MPDKRRGSVLGKRSSSQQSSNSSRHFKTHHLTSQSDWIAQLGQESLTFFEETTSF